MAFRVEGLATHKPTLGCLASRKRHNKLEATTSSIVDKVKGRDSLIWFQSQDILDISSRLLLSRTILSADWAPKFRLSDFTT